MRRQMPLKRALIFIIIMALTAVFAAPAASFADEASGKTVRVGWHEPPYFIKDASGRQSGYSYEYQRKVAAYTGWKYEYVEGNWSELMQKLRNGEIKEAVEEVDRLTDDNTKENLMIGLAFYDELSDTSDAALIAAGYSWVKAREAFERFAEKYGMQQMTNLYFGDGNDGGDDDDE